MALAASSATHALLPLLATRAGLRLQLDAGIRSHRRRFGWDGGFWLPECAYEPGLEWALAERGVEWFCVDQSAHEEPLAALRAGGDRGGAGGAADRLGGDLLALGARRLSLRPGLRPVRRQIAARDAALEGRRRRRTTRWPRRRRRGARRGSSSRRSRSACARYAAERGRRGLSPSRSTPSCSATGGRRARSGWRRCWRARRRPGCGWSPSRRRSKTTSPSGGRCAAPAGARTRTSRPGTRRRSPTSPGRRGGWSCGCCGRCGPGCAATGRQRAARELLAAQASDWAFLDRRGQAGDYAWQRATDHAEALYEAIGCDRDTDPRMRSLSPDMTLTPLLEP